jgi:hypothetical protein
MNGTYILEGKEPKLVTDILVWSRWFENADRRVAKTTVGEVEVSTVFLGLDHSFGGDLPILFETMIFGGEHNDYQERYATWEKAEIGHLKAVKLVKGEKSMICPFNPFTKLPIVCGEPTCEGCEIRIEATARANAEIADSMRDYWKHLNSGAEK